MIKKKVLFHTDYCGASTGFGGFCKEILTYLWKTGKYELHLYAGGTMWDNHDFNRYPWKIYGAIPNNQQEIDNYLRSAGNNDERGARERAMAYGFVNIDKVIHLVKPDVYIANQDFWAMNYCLDKPWWNKINCVINWTADSLPLLQDALDKAPKIKYHFVWAKFAENEFKRLANVEKDLNIKNFTQERQDKIDAFERIKTLRGTVNTSVFRRLADEQRTELRKRYNIDNDTFCVGFGSRNQLRKMIYSLIEGFKLLKDKYPNKKLKLLMLTSWREGWNIPNLMRDHGLDKEDVLCTYRCRTSGDCFIMPFQGEELNNPKTGEQKSLLSMGLDNPLSIEQVNEWYNLLDVFCLPISSGGQERCVQEAKLCELITLMNPYSCGEDNCVSEAYSLPLEYATYREIGTQFIKSTIFPKSIFGQLDKVLNMDVKEQKRWGQNARKWVLDNFSIEIIGKQYEDLIDNMPSHNWDFTYPLDLSKNPNAAIPHIESNEDWVVSLYKNILGVKDVKVEDNAGFQSWISRLQQGDKRENIENFFRDVARKEQGPQQNTVSFESLLIKNDKKNLLIILKESIGDVILSLSLFQSFRKNYPAEHWNIYFATSPQFHELLSGNPNIDKILSYQDFMESETYCTGIANHKGFFDAYVHLGNSMQHKLNYLTNDNIILPQCIS